eukprot:TRINITY_DN19340_c0_g1_i1.p1 TRINITY_DN19340_c0_g1~~TRINITY_DN19340_c0_g1_i1.p1  ORF type:complete len:795 (+),score=198.70 TRINITY_DN19340_c0_g1_i1:62-2386(+)
MSEGILQPRDADVSVMEEPHVLAVESPLKVFTPPDLSQAGNKVYYDSCNDELVVIQGNNIQFSPLFCQGQGKEVNCNNIEQYGQKVGKNPVRGVKRSLGKNYLAVLKNDKEISFYRLKLPRCLPMTAYSVKQSFQLGKAMGIKRTNTVKDFYWLTDSVILILTSTAIETFVITSGSRDGTRTLQRLRHVATTIDYYAYNSKHKVLLCVNKEKPNVIKTYKIGSSSGINRYTKLKIDDLVSKEHHPDRCPAQYSLAGEKLPAYQYIVARLYGHTCILHVTVRQEIAVYSLNTTSGGWDKAAILNLPEKAMHTVNTVDNLIVAHNLTSRNSMIFDHRVSQAPITAPMQIGMGTQVPVQTGTCRVVGKPGGAEWLYSEIEVKFIQPDKLLDLNGRLYGLMVNLRSVIPAFSQRQELLRFLLQRKGSKREALACIENNITSSLPLANIGQMFDLIIASMARGVRESMASSSSTARPLKGPTSPSHASHTGSLKSEKSAGGNGTDDIGSPTSEMGTDDGNRSVVSSMSPASPQLGPIQGSDENDNEGAVVCFTKPAKKICVTYPFYSFAGDWYTTDHVLVLEQVDMLRDVFHRIHETKPPPIPPARFNAVFLEYARSLSSHQIRLKDVLQRFMIDLLIYTEPPDYPKLHHYLQYHVIEDTVPIALQLLKFEDRYPPSFQLALDMLCRERAYPHIVEVLIARGHLVHAAEIMIQYQVKDIDVNHILTKASTCEDPLTLYSLCVLLKKYNMVVRNIRGFSEKDRCTAFEDQYANVLGVPVS